MSYLSLHAASALSELTRAVLERSRFRRLGRRPNVRQAAEFATRELARRVATARPSPDKEAAKAAGLDRRTAAQVDANRRLLLRVAYGWSKERSLQTAKAERLKNLLHCIEPGAGNKAKAAMLNPQKVEAALRALKNPQRWIGSADHFDTAGLLLSDQRFVPTGHVVQGEVARRAAAHLPRAPLPKWFFAELYRFRAWATKCGHSQERVDLSVLRFLGPFCAHLRSEGIERGWHELNATERRRAVRAGLDVEKVWLGISPGIDRVRA